MSARKTRRNRSKRIGGGLMDDFRFEFLNDDFKKVSEEKIQIANGGVIKLYKKDIALNNIDNLLCKLFFEINNKSCYISAIECSQKSDKFKPISFIIVKKLLDILQKKEIEYIYLIASPKGSFPEKLCNLYRSMGFLYPNDYYVF
jgi:hypothetical protein